ncbi:MAG: hypothetical protein IPK23_09335 [Rhizobiales bacterium]|nr:hypothetical protein [Hyphomicrobiales bacterium]
MRRSAPIHRYANSFLRAIRALLFDREDYLNPNGSKRFAAAEEIERVSALAANFKKICLASILRNAPARRLSRRQKYSNAKTETRLSQNENSSPKSKKYQAGYKI